jgi:two-component system OmpR family response regulator
MKTSLSSPEFHAGDSATVGLQCDALKILLVEDEIEIAEFVRNGLAEHGYAVTHLDNGNDGLEAALSGEWDAILLDIMLPGRDGLSILKLLRERKHTVPVVVLSARGEVEERVEGLQLGADDYLPKPFYMAELLARLESVVRRSSGQGLSRLKQEDLDLDLIEHRVWRDGEEIFVSPREYQLLAYFMKQPGRVLSRTQILEQVWEYQFDPGTNLVDSCVRRLRQKVDDLRENPLIETVRGVGYRFREGD